MVYFIQFSSLKVALGQLLPFFTKLVKLSLPQNYTKTITGKPVILINLSVIHYGLAIAYQS